MFEPPERSSSVTAQAYSDGPTPRLSLSIYSISLHFPKWFDDGQEVAE